MTSFITNPTMLFGVLTWLLAFGYQVSFYVLYRLQGSEFLVGQRTVWSYYSGIIGDGVVVPLINMAAFLLLRELKATLNLKKSMLLLSIGFAVTVAIHYTQATLGLTNWAMPEPFFWSGVGRFHFLFMWVEFSFLFWAFYESVRHLKQIYSRDRDLLMLGAAWLAIGLFLLTFVIDYAHLLLAPTAVLAQWR